MKSLFSFIVFLSCLIAPSVTQAKIDNDQDIVDLSQQFRGHDIQPENSFPQVNLITNMGVITVELDRMKAPITVNNFLWLTTHKEFDNTLFHRVIKGFVVQSGGVNPDMTQKADNYLIVNESGNGLRNAYGTIAMARETEAHSASRQFYFNMNQEGNRNLDPNSRRWGYTVFGEVINGMDVLEKISQVHVGADSKNEWDNVPLTKIYLKTAQLISP